MDCSPPGSSVHGISQTRILEWVAYLFSMGTSWPRNQTRVSCTADSLPAELSGKPNHPSDTQLKECCIFIYSSFPSKWIWLIDKRCRTIVTKSLVVQPLSRVRLFSIPRTAAHQASLLFTISRSLFKLMFTESVMPPNHLILCHPLFLLPSIFPSIRVFSNELALCIKYWGLNIRLKDWWLKHHYLGHQESNQIEIKCFRISVDWI